MLQVRDEGSGRWLIEAAHPIGEVANLHLTGVGNADPCQLRRASCLTETRSAAIGAGHKRRCSVYKFSEMRAQGIAVLGQKRTLHPGYEAIERSVDALELDLHRLLVQEVMHLGLGVLAEGLVGIEEPRLGELTHRPSSWLVSRNGDGPFIERLRIVEQHGEVDVGNLSSTLAVGTHAARARVGDFLRLALPITFLECDRSAGAHRGTLNEKALGGPT